MTEKIFEKNVENCCIESKEYIIFVHHKNKHTKTMIDLNTISKQDLESEIICNSDLNDFYKTLDEKIFLNEGYSREELVDLLENWLEINSEY